MSSLRASALALLALTAGAAAHAEQLSLDKAFSGPALWEEELPVLAAADGGHLAYVVRDVPPEVDVATDTRWRRNGAPIHAVGARIFVADTLSGTSKPICENGGYAWRPAWSPDGRYLAFYSDALGPPTVWIFDVATGICRQLANTPVKTKIAAGDEPQWMPDGSGVFVPLYPGEQTGDDVWAWDQARMAERVATEVEHYASGSEAAEYRKPAAAENRESKYLHDAAIEQEIAIGFIDLETGRLDRLSPRGPQFRPAILRLSPSGRWLAIVSVAALDESKERGVWSLAVLDLTTHALEIIAQDVRFSPFRGNLAWHPTRDELVFAKDEDLHHLRVGRTGGKPVRHLTRSLGAIDTDTWAFMPDGEAVIVRRFQAETSGDRALSSGVLFAIVSLDKTHVRKLEVRAEDWSFEGFVQSQPHLLWSFDAMSVTAIGRDETTGERSVLRLSSRDGVQREIWRGRARLAGFAAGRTSPALYGSYEDIQTPANVFAYSSALSPGTRLSSIGLDKSNANPPRLELFTTLVPHSDHHMRRVTTAVLLPSGAGPQKPPPVVVTFYPNIDATAEIDKFGGGNRAGVPAQVLLDHGYAVLYPQVPTGPGDQPGNVIDEMIDALMPQVHAAAARGLIDPTRAALHGNSFGGYATAGIVSRTNFFRAAIPTNGIYDLVSFAYSDAPRGEIAWAERLQPRLGGSLWAQRSRYIDNSPLYGADRIQTPLLILQGGEDWLRPQAESFYVALQRLDKPAQLAIYEGCGHWIAAWPLRQAVAGTERILNFLDKHLRPD